VVGGTVVVGGTGSVVGGTVVVGGTGSVVGGSVGGSGGGGTVVGGSGGGGTVVGGSGGGGTVVGGTVVVVGGTAVEGTVVGGAAVRVGPVATVGADVRLPSVVRADADVDVPASSARSAGPDSGARKPVAEDELPAGAPNWPRLPATPIVGISRGPGIVERSPGWIGAALLGVGAAARPPGAGPRADITASNAARQSAAEMPLRAATARAPCGWTDRFSMVGPPWPCIDMGPGIDDWTWSLGGSGCSGPRVARPRGASRSVG
jgi:hypothetical protein